jgi:ribokinase
LIYVVVTPDGERTMFSSRGANVFTEVTSDLDSYLASARWYHFSGYALLAQPQHTTALTGLDIAKQHRCRVSLDPGPDPVIQLGKQMKKLLEKVDIFFPNEREFQLLTNGRPLKEGTQELLDNGAKAIVIKRGKAGCVAAFEKRYYEIPAFEVQARDTTGAGDAFNAGVILGRMVGLTWPASCVLGNALGAIACMEKGSAALQVTSRNVSELISSQQFKPLLVPWQSAIEEVLAWLL